VLQQGAGGDGGGGGDGEGRRRGAEGEGEVRRDLVAVTCSRSLMRAYVGQTYN